MALYPCSGGGERYRGAANAMYPALVRGNDSMREHLRLCDSHFQQLLNYCRSNLEEVIYDAPGDTQARIPMCSECGGEPGDGRLVFVTAYPKGHDEIQFYGQVCERCDKSVSRRFLLTTG